MASPGQPSQSPPSLTVSTLSSFKEKFPQLNVSLVPSSSSPVQPQPAVGEGPPTSSPPECQAANIATLAEMFPLMTEAALQRALFQCGGRLSSSIDLLLTQDLVDSERHQQSLYTNRFRSICDLWVRGQCIGARAAACRDRHFYNDTDVSRRTCTGSGKNEKKLVGFSSPYRARVVREQVEVIKEQVNVDSGNYERWSEVQERELVDLTGNDAEEIIDLSSDDEKCDKLKESNSEEMERGTENLAEDEPVECKGGMIARRKVPGDEKLAKRKLRFGSENKQSSEVLIENLIVQMESIKDIIEQTAVAIVNTEDLSLKRGKRSQNNILEGNLKRVKIEMPMTNVDDVENTQGGRKVKKKTKRNKVAKSSEQQKTKDSVKSEQCMSRTNEDKKSNQKRKSKRNKGEMRNNKVGEKLDVPVKSEKCSKISKSNVVKSENKPVSSERKRGNDMKQEKV